MSNFGSELNVGILVLCHTTRNKWRLAQEVFIGLENNGEVTGGHAIIQKQVVTVNKSGMCDLLFRCKRSGFRILMLEFCSFEQKVKIEIWRLEGQDNN